MVVGYHKGDKIVLKLEKQGLSLKRSGRLIGWNKGEQFVEYEDITGIEFDKGVMWGNLEISTPGMKIEVERVNKDDGNTFVTLLRDKLEKTRREKYEKLAEISPMDEIKKAKELLDSGAITEQEYEDTKKRYLLIKK